MPCWLPTQNDHADIVFYWIINLLKTESLLCMYWLFFVCIGDHVYLESPPPVCRCWAAVGPTAWFADVEPTLDWPLGLPTLSRRWTDRLVCRRWADVGPLDKITSDRQLMSPAGRRSDQRWSDGGPTATCYLGSVTSKSQHSVHIPWNVSIYICYDTESVTYCILQSS